MKTYDLVHKIKEARKTLPFLNLTITNANIFVCSFQSLQHTFTELTTYSHVICI
jgi:hypothetical protein